MLPGPLAALQQSKEELMAIDKKELWVNWTRDAMSRYVMPDEIEDADDLVDDMANVATQFANQMLDNYEDAFGSRGEGRHRRRKGGEEEETETEE
jgi:hypothetical protein